MRSQFGFGRGLARYASEPLPRRSTRRVQSRDGIKQERVRLKPLLRVLGKWGSRAEPAPTKDRQRNIAKQPRGPQYTTRSGGKGCSGLAIGRCVGLVS